MKKGKSKMADKKEAPLGRVVLRDVRLSYGHIFKPGKGMKDDDGNVQPGKFGANLLMDPDTDVGKANLKRLKKAKEDVMKAKWGDKQPKLKAEKLCTRDGNEEEGEEYQDMYFVSARNPDQPSIIDNRKGKNGKWIPLKSSDGRPYSGCYVNAIVTLWAQDNDYGKRVNAVLESVQFLKHGEAFGAAPVDPNDEFDDDDVEGADVEEIDDPNDSIDTEDDDDDGLV